jgi:hypothetical protein
MVLRYALYTRLTSSHTRLKSMVDLRSGGSTFTGVQNHREITVVNDIPIKYNSLYTIFLAKPILENPQVQESSKLGKGMMISPYPSLSWGIIYPCRWFMTKNSKEISFARTEILGTSFILRLSGGFNMQGGLKYT